MAVTRSSPGTKDAAAAECRAQARHGVAARQWFGRDGHAAQPLELLVQAVEQILVTGMLAVQDDHGRRHGRYSIAPARLRDVWDLRGPRPPEAMSVGPFTNRRTQSAVHAMSGLSTAQVSHGARYRTLEPPEPSKATLPMIRPYQSALPAFGVSVHAAPPSTVSPVE